jgi:protein PsiE
MNVYNLIITAEKCILFFIALLTIFSVGVEMYTVIQNGKIALTDLLLMFIYAEVLGMVAAFYQYRKIPITLPIFIAITALCRLIILQGKGISTVDLIYEGCAVLLLAISVLIIQYGMKFTKENDEQVK